MKIRTITTGIRLKTPLSKKQLREAAQFTLKAKEAFEKKGYEVQTTRIATQSLEKYTTPEVDILDMMSDLEERLLLLGIDFFSIGTVKDPAKIPLIYDILKIQRRHFVR